MDIELMMLICLNLDIVLDLINIKKNAVKIITV